MEDIRQLLATVIVLTALLLVSQAQGHVAQMDKVVTITDAGVVTIVDFEPADTVADTAETVILANTGANPVVCVFAATAPTYSATARWPLEPGEVRAFDRNNQPGTITHIACITDTGATTTLGILAQP